MIAYSEHHVPLGPGQCAYTQKKLVTSVSGTGVVVLDARIYMEVSILPVVCELMSCS
jgi:hypothetical protein